MNTDTFQSKRRFLIFLLIVSLFTLLLGKYNKDIILKNKILPVLSPVISVSNKFIYQTKDIMNSLFHFFRYKSENEKLIKRIDILEKKLIENMEIRVENERLNKLLNFRSQLEYNTIPAKIISQNFSNWYQSILINKGLNDGITPDLAVLSTRGVVGKVTESYKNISKVMLLADKYSQVGGLVHRTRDIGVLKGLDKDYCLLDYLSRNSDIRPGDLIITSGLDGVFPKGIILGAVSKIATADFGLYKYAEVYPSVDFSELEEVLVITKSSGKKE